MTVYGEQISVGTYSMFTYSYNSILINKVKQGNRPTNESIKTTWQFIFQMAANKEKKEESSKAVRLWYYYHY